MNFVFIVNPISGNGKSLKAIKAIEEYCKLIRVNYKIIYTNEKNEATKLVSLYKNTHNSTVFCVGGDGTLNEIVNGIALSRLKLGIVPTGTGNDFYKTFKDYNEDKIDLCKVNDKYFINIASFGLDAMIANYANDLKKHNLPNNLVYVLSLISKYLSFKPINININGKNNSSTILTICNAKYYGGGFQIAPKAILNDGLFDVIDLKSMNKLKIVNLLSKLISVNHLEDKNVNFYRKNSLYVESLIPIISNIDREIIKDKKFKFTLKKEGLNLDIENSKKINEYLKDKKIIKKI